jgi:hypothetical protein
MNRERRRGGGWGDASIQCPPFLLFALFVSALLACSPPVSGDFHPTVSLRLASSGPADASVIIDEQAIGTLDFVVAHGVALPPGVHHITVKADGYFPWDQEVAAKLGDPPIRLKVALVRVPD